MMLRYRVTDPIQPINAIATSIKYLSHQGDIREQARHHGDYRNQTWVTPDVSVTPIIPIKWSLM